MSAAFSKGFAVIPTAHRRVLLSAWQANRNRSSLWLLALVGLLMASAPISVWWSIRTLPVSVSVQVNAILSTAMPFAAIVLAAAWAMLVFNVLRQNHPHTARLLPAQLPALRNTLLGTAALLCAVSTLLSWLAGGPVLATAAGMALGLASVALSLRWPWVWLVVATLGSSLPLLSVGGHLEPVTSLWRAAPEVLTVLALVLAALALRAVVMTGDARHERAHTRLRMMNAAAWGQLWGTSSQSLGGLAGWAMKRGNSAYAAWLGRLLAQARPNVRARLAMGLGPQTHWTGVLAGQAMGVTLVVLMLLAVQLFPHWEVGQAMAGGLMLGTAFGGLAVSLVQLPAALWASRREQSLLRLLPGVPQGAQLNRWLAARLAGVHLTVLVMQGLLVLVMSGFVDSNIFGGQAGALALSALLLSVLLVFTLWRNWARAKAPAGGAQVLMMLAASAIYGLAAAWVYWLHRPWFELAALTLLLMLPLGWWRWRLISRAPTAWPMGRLG